ncbi:WD repeat-containing protein 6-like isoform X2 [Acanthaster planci]|uniref:tRNA (34-2'-O)-methyltransferase regulator WDR6 n=1 Tax=Acanthaster planci TaxID=133434 RepID=A0A8B7YTF0_ACAPL|nr:WD repeat-containing protein 6-like isoform X2 [Acanthaster planci]
MEITTAAVLAPVTAIEVHKNYILSGEASYLHVYNLASGKHLEWYCLLGAHVIHGIRRGEDHQYAVFGQKAVCVVLLELGENVRLSVLCELAEFPDWILDVALLGKDESPSPAACLGLILAHNSAMLWDWKQKACLQHIHSAENCILYSARLLGSTWDDMTVVAGTVFNQVVIWKTTGPRDTEGRVPVERRLTGHQGVIFNLSYHRGRKLLCSVSDDRSIRLWHLDLGKPPAEQSGAVHRVMYGHSARVWDAKILDQFIASIGEDATCCVWNDTGEVIHRFTGHKGRSIWSLAVDETQQVIVTGGGDSSIRIWPIGAKQEESDPLASAGPGHGLETLTDAEGFNPRQLAVLNSGKIIILTLNGCLLCYMLRSKQWQLLSHDPNYQSYCLLSVCPSHQVAALGNIQGSLKIVALDCGLALVELPVFTGKIFSLCWQNEDNIFATGPDGVVIWYKADKSSKAYCLVEAARFLLPQAPQRWLTTVTLVPNQEGALVCGDRRGSVLLYTNLHRTRPEEKLVGPTHSLPCIHGKSGVTHVCYHAGCIYSTGRDGMYRQNRLQGTRLEMMNTCKVYKGFEWIENISFTAADDVLVCGFHASSFIVWSHKSNEKLIQIHCGGGHRAWSFANCEPPLTQGESSTHGDTVARKDGTCGSLAIFACIKTKKVIVCTAPGEKLQRHPTLKESLHGRRITCIKFLTTVSLPDGECALCATGSEDNAVNLVAIRFPVGEPSTLQILHRLQVHISSVRCLAACPSSFAIDPEGEPLEQGEVTGGQEAGQRLLLFSVGGRRAILCWRLTLPQHCPLQDQASVLLKSMCTVEHLMSYGNTDNVKQRRWLKRHGKPVDPETRFMSASLWKGNKVVGYSRTECILGVAGSDAYLRLFVFNEQTREMTPLVSTNSQGCCLLATLGITLDFPWGLCPVLLTAGTNGRIVFWDIQKALRECSADCTEDSKLAKSELNTNDKSKIEVLETNQQTGAISRELSRSMKEQCSNTKMSASGKDLCSISKEAKVSIKERCDSNAEPSSDDVGACSNTTAQCRNPKEQFSNTKELFSDTREPCSSTRDSCHHITTDTDQTSSTWYTLPPLSKKEREEPGTIQKHQDMQRTKPLASQKELGALAMNLTETDSSGDSEDGFRQSLLSIEAHQSGINALCMSQLDGNRFLLASGGDDNSIQLSLLSVSAESDRNIRVSVEHTHSITCAHAAQVTGLCFTDVCTLVSSSIDQRLSVWSISISPDKTSILKVKQFGSSFTLIADCAGMAHWTLRHAGHVIMVCGQGVQVLHLKESEGTRPGTCSLPSYDHHGVGSISDKLSTSGRF